jgi:hypothetical protein
MFAMRAPPLAQLARDSLEHRADFPNRSLGRSELERVVGDWCRDNSPAVIQQAHGRDAIWRKFDYISQPSKAEPASLLRRSPPRSGLPIRCAERRLASRRSPVRSQLAPDGFWADAGSNRHFFHPLCGRVSACAQGIERRVNARAIGTSPMPAAWRWAVGRKMAWEPSRG